MTKNLYLLEKTGSLLNVLLIHYEFYLLIFVLYHMYLSVYGLRVADDSYLCVLFSVCACDIVIIRGISVMFLM